MPADFDVGQVLARQVMERRVFERLTDIPRKILMYHELQELPQIVLHDMSHDDVFGLDKAVYLVDNPDFDCLKGVAGFSRDECKFHHEDVWQKPDTFGKDMQSACFNSQMKQFLRNGLKRKDIDTHDENDLIELGHVLGMKNPSFLTWRMKHGNHGILLFESNEQVAEKKRNLLSQAGPLLSLC